MNPKVDHRALPDWVDEEEFRNLLNRTYPDEPVGTVFANMAPVCLNWDYRYFWVLKITEDDWRYTVMLEDILSLAVLRGLEVIRKAK